MSDATRRQLLVTNSIAYMLDSNSQSGDFNIVALNEHDADDSNDIIGLLELIPVEHGSGKQGAMYVATLEVSQDHQRRGIATMMYELAIQEARKRGKTIISVHAERSSDAQALHKSLGKRFPRDEGEYGGRGAYIYRNPKTKEEFRAYMEDIHIRKLAFFLFMNKHFDQPFEAKVKWGTMFAHRDPHDAKKPWRMSFFDEKGRPTGHTTYTHGFEELAEDAWALGVQSPEQVKHDNWSLNPSKWRVENYNNELPPPESQEKLDALLQEYRSLSSRVDMLYESNRLDEAAEADTRLEEISEQLEALLSGLEEGAPDESLAVQPDVEDQLVERYADFIKPPQRRTILVESDDEFAENIREVLLTAGASQLKTDRASTRDLIELARDVYDRRLRLIQKHKQAQPRRNTCCANPSSPPSGCLEIGRAYIAAPDAADDPAVRLAYKRYSDETSFLFSLIRVKVIFTEDDPYKTSAEMRESVLATKEMRIFSGGSEHPILSVEQNLRGRAVHDLLAHIVCGCPFTATGEFNAFEAQAALYGVEIRPLLFAEIVGQTCAYIVNREKHVEQKAILMGEEFERLAQPMRRQFAKGLGLAGVIEHGLVDKRIVDVARSTGYELRYQYAVLETQTQKSIFKAANDPVAVNPPSVAPKWSRWLRR